MENNKKEEINIYSNNNRNPNNINNITIPKIRVIVRKRPANQKELLQNDIDIIETHKEANTIIVKELKYTNKLINIETKSI